MSGKLQFAVDTSFVIAILKGAIRSDRSLSDVAFPFAVIGELRFGALGARNSQQRVAEIDKMVRSGVTLAADAETAHAYSELRHKLKTAGTPLPENDVWIASVCLQHGLTLLTLDRHFEGVQGLKLATS